MKKISSIVLSILTAIGAAIGTIIFLRSKR
jgi:hypothetical protein